jgi:hypothetical protein
MSKRAFLFKLAAFLAPFVAVFALPMAVLVRTWEIAPPQVLAAAHRRAPKTAVYGPVYGNPDKGYKLASIQQREPVLITVGTSRVMQFRSDFFVNEEATFYNGGGIVTRLFDYRILFRRLAALRTRKVIVGLDQWAFNENWFEFWPDAAVDREYACDYSTLDVIQRSLRVYPDVLARKLDLRRVFSPSESFGVNGITHGNGFLRDGSYRYADMLRESLESPGFKDENTMARIRTGTLRFEPGETPSHVALDELEKLATRWERDGFEVVAFMPPYAPSVLAAMHDTGRLAYAFKVGDAVRQILDRHGVAFVDFTSCGDLDCHDEDFIDGFHGGSVLYARILLELSRHAAWLAELTARDGLERRLKGPTQSWELPAD